MSTKWIRWGTFLALAAGLMLQTVGATLYNTTATSRSVLSLIWLVGPLFTWGAGLLAVLNHRGAGTFGVFEWIWFSMLGLHAFRAGLIGGWLEAAMTFLSWGAWFGSYLWISTSPGGSRWIVRGVAGLFFGIGIVLATGDFIEAALGITLTKQTTIGVDLVRRYGFAASVVNGGIQIGCGIAGTLYFLVETRAWLSRLLLSALVGYQCLGLLLTTARGPILLSLAAMGIVTVIGLARRNPGIQCHTVLLGVGGIALMPVAVEAGWLSIDIIEYIQSALRTDDVSNAIRIVRISDTLRMTADSVAVVLLGLGAGETGVLPAFRGNETLTSESSAMKLWLETGVLGLLTFYALLLLALFRGIRLYGRLGRVASTGGPEPLQQLCILGCLGIVSAEAMFHDLLTTWVISGVYWTALGALRAANRGAQDLLAGRKGTDSMRRSAASVDSAAEAARFGVTTRTTGS